MSSTISELTNFEQITIQHSNRDFWLNVIIALITFISVWIVFSDYKNRKNKERAEKSISIAEQFAQSVIPKISILFDYFESLKLPDIINKVKFINFTDFDIEELRELYCEQDIALYQKALSQTKTIKINDTDIILENFIITILNELEHMSMYIVTGVADEKYIYNSLHQQFFKTVSSLYISISLTNIDNKDKYYTNIIEAFNLWKKKYIKFSKKEKKLKEKLKSKVPKI